MDKPVIDRARLDDATGGDEEFLHELIEIFLEDADLRIRELKDALSSADGDTFGRTAHKLKGSSANMGAVRMYDYARQLEELGKQRALSSVGPLLVALESEMERARVELERLTTSPV